jgi:uncharacterized membrane protein YcaP (DUF421 family)
MSAAAWARMWHPQQSPLETVLRAVIVYVFVHVAFRVVGRKVLGRYSTFEIVLVLLATVAMRMGIVSDDPSLTTAIVGFATLLAVDVGVARLVAVSPAAAWLVDGPVRELVRDGRVDDDALRRARVSHDQLLSAVRCHGRERLEDVRAAHLERSGHISVVFRDAVP